MLGVGDTKISAEALKAKGSGGDLGGGAAVRALAPAAALSVLLGTVFAHGGCLINGLITFEA